MATQATISGRIEVVEVPSHEITAGTENLQKPLPISPIAWGGRIPPRRRIGASYGLAHLVIKITSETMKKPFTSRAFSAPPGHAGVPCGMKMIDQHFGDVGAGTTWRRFKTEGTHGVSSSRSECYKQLDSDEGDCGGLSAN